MSETGLTNDAVNQPAAKPARNGGRGRNNAVEERVRRLEDAVAALQDTRQLEERVVARVQSQVERQRPQPAREGGGTLIESSRRLLPMARELLSTSVPVAQMAEVVQQRPLGPRTPEVNGSMRRSWFLWTVYCEARSLWRMIVDPRYRMTWPGRAAACLTLPIFLFSYWLWPVFWWLPNFILIPMDKLIGIVLLFFAYKILKRETVRYRELVPEYDVTYGS